MITAAPLIAAVTLLATVLPGQIEQEKTEQEKLIEKRDNKLASEWLKNAAWVTDYDKARAQAKESGKLIFAYFTRSYSP